MRTFLERGTYLLANPQGTDPNFMKTVVLICEHNENGAFGLILNRSLKTTIQDIFPDKNKANNKNTNVFFGGPVETNKLFCLHSTHEDDIYNCQEICKGVYLGTHHNCLEDLLANKDMHDSFRLFLGCSCWSGGQLENEIKMNFWTVGPANENIVFYPHPNKLWWYIVRFISGYDPDSPFNPSGPILN